MEAERSQQILKAKIKKNIDFEKIFDKEIIILKNEKIYKLNEEATIIWKYIGQIPTEKICEKIAKIKKQKIEKVKHDVMKFLNELLNLDIISIEHGKKRK